MSLAFNNFAVYHPDKSGVVAADIIKSGIEKRPGLSSGLFPCAETNRYLLTRKGLPSGLNQLRPSESDTYLY
jgi:hypothetical protein